MSLTSSAVQPPLPNQLPPDTPDVANPSRPEQEPLLSNRTATNSSALATDELNKLPTPIVEHSAPEKSDRSSSTSSAATIVTKDDEITSLKKVAEQSDPEAQFKLGVRYDDGNGVKESKEEAFNWYHKAAEQGHIQAQVFVGDRYYFGEGVEENKEEAFNWYHKAAELGHSKAQRCLSECYQHGTGTDKNLPLATYWYLIFLLKIPSTNLNLEDDQELIKLIPDTLKNYSIFKQLKVIRLFAGESLTSEGIASIASFIRSNPSIETLKISADDVGISNDQASELAEALKFNTKLTRLQLKDNDSSVENLHPIQPLLNQNKNIAVLRKYVKKHPLISTVDIPVDVIKILDKQIIVSYLRSGETKEATRKAIDEFLVIASTTALAKDSKTN